MMFLRFTFLPPVIFVAMTIFARRDGSCLCHRPMTSSVRPSGRRKSDGIGYCSAVSTRLMPDPRMARSMNLWQRASSGALKSVETQRWVPRPISETMTSPPPNRFCRIPSTTPTTSLVGPPLPEPRGAGGVAASARLAPISPSNRLSKMVYRMVRVMPRRIRPNSEAEARWLTLSINTLACSLVAAWVPAKTWTTESMTASSNCRSFASVICACMIAFHTASSRSDILGID
mmetsp:Transcript_119390/g.207848  ORF Transcript_119390/g.207848 Transcript_119390/m.207848 type:complete len:231 (-) Transcript_119390:456-1148(-)